MDAKALTPILNVSDMQQSFLWFKSLGWTKGFEWGEPVGFGSVCSGECEIFLCHNAQGGRGKGTQESTFSAFTDEQQDTGIWLSIWVEDVDKVHQQCLKEKIEITWPPTDMPWNVREMHLRHPDGHVFRISCAVNDHDH